MDTEIFFTEYNGITTAFHIPTSKMYSVRTEKDSKDELTKYISKEDNIAINCERKPLEKIVGISIGCADTCNLACSYCYANGGTYNNDSKKIMNEKDFDILLNCLLDYEYAISNINFFGGEPLLSYKGIKHFILKTEKEFKNKFNNNPQFSAVTNGTLIDEEMVDFFNEHFSAITISIDGPEEICNATRIAIDPKISVYRLISKSMEFMRKLENKKFHLRAVATLTPETLRQIIDYGTIEYRNSFYQLGFDSVAFFQATGIEWSCDSLEKLKDFYYIIMEDTFNKIVNGDIYQTDDSTMAYLVDILKRHYNGDCVAGLNYLYYTPEGKMYPCQMYYNERKETVDALKRYKVDKCAKCPVMHICQSYCAGAALSNNKSENVPIEELCIIEKFKFEYIVKRYGYEVYYRKRNDDEYKKFIGSIKEYASINAASKRFTAL